jgi:hypothetical protein
MQPLLATLRRQHVIGLSVNNIGGNIGLVAHCVNCDDAALLITAQIVSMRMSSSLCSLCRSTRGSSSVEKASCKLKVIVCFSKCTVFLTFYDDLYALALVALLKPLDE